MSSGIA